MYNARVFEEGSVKSHCVFGFPVLLSDKHQEWRDFLLAAGKIQLPRKAEFILYPSEFFTERIFIQFHKNHAALRKLAPQLIYFFLCHAVHEERYGWREFVVGTTV